MIATNTNELSEVLDRVCTWTPSMRITLARKVLESLGVTTSSLTDVFYVARRHAGRDRAWLAIRACLDQLYIIAVGINELQEALRMSGNDFEDNVQIVCAMAAEIDAIATRDPAGFLISQIVVVSPQEILLRLAAED